MEFANQTAIVTGVARGFGAPSCDGWRAAAPGSSRATSTCGGRGDRSAREKGRGRGYRRPSGCHVRRERVRHGRAGTVEV